MPIRFRCSQCGRVLKTARRKIGLDIECPKCGSAQPVPNEEAAALTVSMGRRRRSSGRRPPPLPVQRRSGPARAGQIPFWPRYRPAIALLGTALAAFLVGYLAGRGHTGSPGRPTAASERFLLEGKISYDPGTRSLIGDEGAVAIALPEGRFPRQPWSPYDLRPQDPTPGPGNRTVRAIQELGGAYVRADALGEFSVVLSPGSYQILLISRHTARPPGSLIDELDKTQVGRYFSDPGELIGNCKYRWISRELKSGSKPAVACSFGRDLKP